eukprot:6528065-Pyramimonas_sp.AAC.1
MHSSDVSLVDDVERLGRMAATGVSVALDWERGRLFDRDVAAALHTSVADAGVAEVTDVNTKEERKPRPPGLNTVELLKVYPVTLSHCHTVALSHCRNVELLKVHPNPTTREPLFRTRAPCIPICLGNGQRVARLVQSWDSFLDVSAYKSRRLSVAAREGVAKARRVK